jgi:two-component system response regulator
MLGIVLVDDAEEDMALLERIVRQCKILNPLHRLRSGEECISFFEQAKKNSRAARCLVFLDLIMAPISGISVLSRLKESGAAADSVFVMLSGITDLKAINEGYKLGAQTFLIKPVTAHDMLETLSGLKSRICVEGRTEGYVLEWIVPGKKTAMDTDFFRRINLGFPK